VQFLVCSMGAIDMVSWKLKDCPRCDGDIFVDRDLYGWFEQCIQCGYNHDLRNTVKLGQQQTWSEQAAERRATILSNSGSW